jgi:prepilin-type processing-associated H-X9-DG protein
VERHLGTTNVLWCDGHVKAMKLDALAKPRNATNANVMSFLPSPTIERAFTVLSRNYAGPGSHC